MNKMISLMVVLISLMSMSMVFAGEFKLNYQGKPVFTISNNGTVNASGSIYQNGVLLSQTYLALNGGSLTGVVSSNSNISTSAYFVGDGRFLTNIAVPANSTTISYKNITDLPTCTGSQVLTYSGSALTCTSPTVASNSVNIAGENITSGTIAFARLPTLTNTHTLAYQNITGIPQCSAGQVMTYNATGFVCVTTSQVSLTNVAFTNQTNTFTGTQAFSNDVNVSGSLVLQSATASIKRGTTNITIDDTGNINFWLG